MPFVKIHQTILDSSIWAQPDHTRIVWITMLAMANEFGIVEASQNGLAYRARVSDEECAEALKCLSEPDVYSRNADDEGRRIESVAGGWLILNHMDYRDRQTAAQIKSNQRVRRFRERRRKAKETAIKCNDETPRSDLSPSETDLEAYKRLVSKKVDTAAFEEFWRTYPKRNGKRRHRNRAVEIWGKLTDEARSHALIGAKHFLRSTDVKENVGIPDAFRWLRDKQYLDWQEPEAQPVGHGRAVRNTYRPPDPQKTMTPAEMEAIKRERQGGA